MAPRPPVSDEIKKEGQARRFKKWYDKHSKAHNKLRRKKYETDDEYRQRCINHSALTRKKQAKRTLLETAR